MVVYADVEKVVGAIGLYFLEEVEEKRDKVTLKLTQTHVPGEHHPGAQGALRNRCRHEVGGRGPGKGTAAGGEGGR